MKYSRMNIATLTTLFTVSSFVVVLSLFHPAHGQIAPSLTAPQAARQLDLVITWKGYSLVPTAYEGRILSPGKAPVLAQLQAFENGSPVSLSGYDIEWRSNGIPYARGEGKTQFSFITEEYPPSSYTVTVTVREGRAIVGTAGVEIPVSLPKVVISAPYPDKKIPRTDATLQALPYFFSAKEVSDISFSWRVAGYTIPLDNLFVNFASLSFDGAKEYISVSVLAENKVVKLEKVTATTYVDVQ